MDAFGVQEFTRTLLSAKYWILACVLFFGGLALAYGLLATPIFRSEVVMIPAPIQEGDPSSAGRLLGSLGGGLGVPMQALNFERSLARTEALALLTSYSLLAQFVERERLMPELFESSWDASRNDWMPDDAVPTMGDAYELLTEDVIAVIEETDSDLITLRVEWRDRAKVAEWANGLVERVNQIMRQRAIDNADKSLAYLNLELESTNVVELQQAIFRLIESKVQDKILANVTEEYAFRVIDPAFVADPDKHERPKRLLLVAIGVLFGFVVGPILKLVVRARTLT